MDFILAHAAVLSALLVAIIDFGFAVSPGLASNGLLHGIYVWLKGSSVPKA